MKLNIHSHINNKVKLIVAPDDSSRQTKGIMEDNTLSLSFTTTEKVILDVNDYVDYLGERYILLTRYNPEMVSKFEYNYACTFYGIESELQRVMCVNTADGAFDANFSLTAQAIEHVRLIVANINRVKNTTIWKVGEILVSDNLTIDYTGISCADALKMLADELSLEWWIDGTTINLSRCEHGLPLTLARKNGLISLTKDDNENMLFFTRLIPIGSTRNIDPNSYGSKRLKLPDGVKYVDQNTDTYGIIEHVEEDTFSDIYPQRTGTLSAVRFENKIIDGVSQNIYFVKDSGLNFNPNDYELPGLIKHVVFTSGSLNGYDFEVNYNASLKEFEIINQHPYDDLIIPQGGMIPKIGDNYVMYNIKMPTEYITQAEITFKQAVAEYMSRYDVDKAIYKGQTDYINIGKRNLSITLGQKVLLNHPVYFSESGRESRIVRISRQVNAPHNMDVDFSDVRYVGKLSNITGNVDTATHIARQALASVPDIIKSYEETLGTDTNLYSAKKCDRDYLHTRKESIAHEVITFMKEIIISGFKTHDFNAGAMGSGVGIVNGTDVHADNFLARKSFTAIEWIISKMRHQGGQLILSGASGKITSVEELDNGYKCYIETAEGKKQNEFTIGHQARCQEYTTQGKYYWRLVMAVGSDYVFLSKTDCDGAGIPEVGDELIGLGHRTNKALQGATMLSSVNSQIGTFVYDGINSYSLEGKLISWQGVNGDERGGMFSGSLVVKGSSSGLKEFEEFEELYTIHITSDNGNLFTNGNVVTTLRAQVLEYATDITDTLQDNQFYWKRVSENTEQDTIWNLLHEAIGPNCTITSEDVHRKATFFCEVRIGNQLYKSK